MILEFHAPNMLLHRRGGTTDAQIFSWYLPNGGTMPRGDKSKYTDKEKRQEQHIEEGYESHGVSREEAERRAWATVNKVHGGGEKPGGSGYGKGENHESMRKGGKNSHK
jgi:hypothetical protein